MTIDDLYELRCRTPHNIDKHLPLLKSLASRCESITEFGTETGFSTTAFLAARPKTLHCYDIWFPAAFDKVLQCQGIETEITLHRGNTLLVPIIDPTDLLFIDSVHTYEQVKGELERHGHQARKYLVFHDIVTFSGIVPAIQEWLDPRPEWIIRRWNLEQSGMAVLERVKRDLR